MDKGDIDFYEFIRLRATHSIPFSENEIYYIFFTLLDFELMLIKKKFFLVDLKPKNTILKRLNNYLEDEICYQLLLIDFGAAVFNDNQEYPSMYTEIYYLRQDLIKDGENSDSYKIEAEMYSVGRYIQKTLLS